MILKQTLTIIPHMAAALAEALGYVDQPAGVPATQRNLPRRKAQRLAGVLYLAGKKNQVLLRWLGGYVKKPFGCPVCLKAAGKRSEHIHTHLALVHDIDVTWHECHLCDKRFKLPLSLRVHLAGVHNIDVTWHDCHICSKRCKMACHLRKHLAYMHDIDVTWHDCHLCDKRCKQAVNLRTHLALVHDIDATWHHCHLCSHRTKQVSHLRQHLADVHDINVRWHQCDLCEYRTKQGGCLREHIRRCHSEQHAQRRKQQEERVRQALLDAGWLEWHLSETMPPAGYFKREKHIDFQCAGASTDRQFARIDFVLGVRAGAGYVFLEVDEHQHRYGYESEQVSCDMKRMNSVLASINVEFDFDPPSIYWLRYNPSAWHVDGVLRRVPTEERLRWLLDFLGTVTLTEPVGIGYAYYDADDTEGLEVTSHEEYHDSFRCLVENLT